MSTPNVKAEEALREQKIRHEDNVKRLRTEASHEIVNMKLAMEEEKKESSVEATVSLKAKLDSCMSVAGGDAIKEEVAGPEKLIGFRKSKTDKVKTVSSAVKLEPCSSVADGDAIKEEVSGSENVMACRGSKTDKVKTDIRAVK